MDVLNDQRKVALTQILLARLAHRAVGRIGPEGFVIRAPIVITSEPEPAREDQDDHRHGHEARQEAGYRPEPGVFARAAEKQRRVHRRQVGTEAVMVPLEGRPSGVYYEPPQTEKREERINPPGVAAGSLSKPATL